MVSPFVHTRLGRACTDSIRETAEESNNFVVKEPAGGRWTK